MSKRTRDQRVKHDADGKIAVPAMEKSEGSPSFHKRYRDNIVNIASIAGLIGRTPMLLYPTSKGAIVNMTRAMAAHHAPMGIRVNCVCPGICFHSNCRNCGLSNEIQQGCCTRLCLYSHGMATEVQKARRKRSLLQTEENRWECGAAVRFLASEEARLLCWCFAVL